MRENLGGGVRKHDGGLLTAGGVREYVHQHWAENAQNRPEGAKSYKCLMSCLE